MYRIFFAENARRDFRELVEWLAARNPVAAARTSIELQDVFRRDLHHNPTLYAHFWLTGRPYRGRLFSVSRNTKYWIVYEVRESERVIRIVRIWNASLNPNGFDL